MNRKTCWNCYTGEERILPPYSVLSSVTLTGTTNLGGSDSPLADAIPDRIIYDSYKINIEYIDPGKDRSMREVYGLDETISE